MTNPIDRALDRIDKECCPVGSSTTFRAILADLAAEIRAEEQAACEASMRAHAACATRAEARLAAVVELAQDGAERSMPSIGRQRCKDILALARGEGGSDD